MSSYMHSIYITMECWREKTLTSEESHYVPNRLTSEIIFQAHSLINQHEHLHYLYGEVSVASGNCAGEQKCQPKDSHILFTEHTLLKMFVASKSNYLNVKLWQNSNVENLKWKNQV